VKYSPRRWRPSVDWNRQTQPFTPLVLITNEVFTSSHLTLHVRVFQRKPVLLYQLTNAPHSPNDYGAAAGGWLVCANGLASSVRCRLVPAGVAGGSLDVAVGDTDSESRWRQTLRFWLSSPSWRAPSKPCSPLPLCFHYGNPIAEILAIGRVWASSCPDGHGLDW
jgi:hypothetical protein